MKYLDPNENKISNVKNYFEYIDSIKENLPNSVYDFASNSDHYNLTSHDSLHDSWLNFIKIREEASGERSEERKTVVEIEFLGGFHDKKIHLIYKNIINININQKNYNVIDGHGDLLMHEFRLDENHSIIHELVFDKGGIYIIQFQEFEYFYENI